MPVLNTADALKIGAQNVTRAYLGAAIVWQPPVVITGIEVVSVSDGGAQAATASIPAPANIVAGNLLYAVASADDSAATSTLASTGWTLHKRYIFTTRNDNGNIYGFYKIASASEPAAYTFSGTNVHALNVGIMQLSGVDPNDPFGGIAPTAAKAAASTVAAYPAITTTVAGKLLAVAAQAGNYSGSVSNACTPGAGYTGAVSSVSQYASGSVYDAESTFAALSDATLDPGSLTPPSGTFNVSYVHGTMTVFLKPSPN